MQLWDGRNQLERLVFAMELEQTNNNLLHRRLQMMSLWNIYSVTCYCQLLDDITKPADAKINKISHVKHILRRKDEATH